MTETSVYLDTNVIISIVESPLSDGADIQDFWRYGTGLHTTPFHTSELSLAELLVVPYRSGDNSLVGDYLRLFSAPTTLNVHMVSKPILDVAAVIRSRRKMKLPDAIHLATASITNCTYFITFDSGFSDLDPDRHPLFEDVILPPVTVVHPDPRSLADLMQALQ